MFPTVATANMLSSPPPPHFFRDQHILLCPRLFWIIRNSAHIQTRIDNIWLCICINIEAQTKTSLQNWTKRKTHFVFCAKKTPSTQNKFINLTINVTKYKIKQFQNHQRFYKVHVWLQFFGEHDNRHNNWCLMIDSTMNLETVEFKYNLGLPF